MNRRAAGTAYEKKAAAYLERCGYHILTYNFRCPAGEIDLIATHGIYLVFIEVKYRRDGRTGNGLEAVDYRKQRRIRKAASWYLMKYYPEEIPPCRFDVAAFEGDKIQVVQDAFQC